MEKAKIYYAECIDGQDVNDVEWKLLGECESFQLNIEELTIVNKIKFPPIGYFINGIWREVK